MDNSDFYKLVNRINASAINPEGWEGCLEDLRHYFGSIGSLFFIYDTALDMTTSVLTCRFDPSFLNSYLDYYHTINPYLEGNKTVICDTALTDEASMPRPAIRKSEFYNDWVIPQEIDLYQLGCKIQIDKDRFAILVVFPHGRYMEKKEAEDKKKFAALIPYLKNSLSANYMLEEQKYISAGIEHAFSRLDIGVLVLDNRFRIILSNSAAEKFLSVQNVIKTERHTGALKAIHPESSRQLSRLLEHGRAGLIPAHTQKICLHAVEGSDKYLCSVQPIPSEPFDMLGQGYGNFSLLSQRPRILVLLSKPGVREAPPPYLLMNLFSLTRAEAMLASAIANGETVANYAKRNDLSRNTLKTQLSSIFDKTGVSRQAELVTLIWRSLAPPGF